VSTFREFRRFNKRLKSLIRGSLMSVENPNVITMASLKVVERECFPMPCHPPQRRLCHYSVLLLPQTPVDIAKGCVLPANGRVTDRARTRYLL
jgi:hypothetical protein